MSTEGYLPPPWLMSRRLAMAVFEVTLYGRFWVTPEVNLSPDSAHAAGAMVTNVIIIDGYFRTCVWHYLLSAEGLRRRYFFYRATKVLGRIDRFIGAANEIRSVLRWFCAVISGRQNVTLALLYIVIATTLTRAVEAGTVGS